MELHDRLRRIVQCCDEIERAVKAQVPGEFGCLLWELDWRRELHRLLFEEE